MEEGENRTVLSAESELYPSFSKLCAIAELFDNSAMNPDITLTETGLIGMGELIKGIADGMLEIGTKVDREMMRMRKKAA